MTIPLTYATKMVAARGSLVTTKFGSYNLRVEFLHGQFGFSTGDLNGIQLALVGQFCTILNTCNRPHRIHKQLRKVHHISLNQKN